MSPPRTIALIALANLLAIAALAGAVHLRLLAGDVALWIAMFVMFVSWRAVQSSLQARRHERSKRP